MFTRQTPTTQLQQRQCLMQNYFFGGWITNAWHAPLDASLALLVFLFYLSCLYFVSSVFIKWICFVLCFIFFIFQVVFMSVVFLVVPGVGGFLFLIIWFFRLSLSISFIFYVLLCLSISFRFFGFLVSPLVTLNSKSKDKLRVDE